MDWAHMFCIYSGKRKTDMAWALRVYNLEVK